ncbi:MAG: phosphatase PAP2 family protein [Rhodococcus sp. (in: high G+C Gram-positive bacteria)]
MDQAVLDWMVEHRSPWATTLFTLITTVGSTVGVTLATVVVALLLARSGFRQQAIAMGLTLAIGWGLMNALKYAFRRERPPLPERLVELSSYAFPSGHAMMSAMFAAALVTVLVTIRVAPKRTRAAAAVVTAASLLIGLSRIYLGAHWFSDVVAGWTFGALFGVAGVLLSRKLLSAGAVR